MKPYELFLDHLDDYNQQNIYDDCNENHVVPNRIQQIDFQIILLK